MQEQNPWDLFFNFQEIDNNLFLRDVPEVREIIKLENMPIGREYGLLWFCRIKKKMDQ
jgi:hypothetical protein